ncbi:BatD family protein [Allochromatium tepidum]|nr:BatD family protein [Allochromatium tepidum]
MAQRYGRAILLVLLWLTLSASAQAADLSVQVDRQRLELGEVLELRLVAEGDLDAEPDFTPLEPDFDILRRGQSQMTSIINGRISHSRQWSLQLAPRRAGRLTIPAIQAGSDTSRPLSIEVIEPGRATARSGQTDQSGPRVLFVESEVETTTPYVLQPIEYRIKVYYRQPPQRAVLSEPEVEGSTVQRLGEDRAYDETRDGQVYRVIERRYRLTPQRSGPITVQSPRLEAMLEDPRQGARQDPFAELDQAFGGRLFQGFPTMPGVTHPGRRVVERARDIELQVRPQPPSHAGTNWLPATSLQLTDEWTPSPPVFQVGEPITRTLTITAEGTAAAQLPDLALGALDGVQVYPDQPRGEDLTNGPSPAAIKTLKFALVPTRPGTLTLPEIRLDWWDTRTDRARVAVIPARTVEVAPAPDSTSGASEPMAGAAAPTQATQPESDSMPESKPSPTSEFDRGRGFWLWPALIVLLVGGWGATLYLWQRERRARTAAGRPTDAGIRGAPSAPPPTPPGLDPARRAFRAACLARDPRAARAAIIDWAHARWPDRNPTGLEAVATGFDDPEVHTILRTIDRAIYAPPSETWDGETAWKRLEPYLGATRSSTSDRESPIPDLYPRT